MLYQTIASDDKYKAIRGEGHLSMLSCVARISDCWCQLDSVCLANVSDRFALKILTPKHLLQRLLIAPTQVKAGNTSDNLLNEIHQIKYSLYRARENATYIVNSMKL